MPNFICPNCGDRSESTERTAGFSEPRARAARSAASASCSSCSTTTTRRRTPPSSSSTRRRRLIGAGRGARELTGLGDLDVIGRAGERGARPRVRGGDDHIATALEWGVRVLDKPVIVHAEGDRPEPAKADIFPAYDDDGGLLLVLTPRMTIDDPQPRDPRARASLLLAALVIVRCIAHEADAARPRPEGRRRAGLRGPPDAAGARRSRRRRSTTRSRRSASAPTPSASPSPRSSARARPDLDRPARRAERRPRDRAGRHHRAAPVLRLGAERPRPTAGRTRPVRGARRRSTRRSRWRRGRSPRRRRRTSRRGLRGRSPEEADRQNDTARRPLLPVRAGPSSRSGPTSSPCATGDYEPSGHLRTSCWRTTRPSPGQRERVAEGHGMRGPSSKALGPGGPPDGSQVHQGAARASWSLEAERSQNQPASVKRFFVLEDDSELSGTDIKNPEQNFDPNTKEPIVTMEFTDKGREAFARVTKRIAERGVGDHRSRRAPTRADASSASRSRSTTRSSRSRRSTSSRTPRASTAAPARRSTGIGDIAGDAGPRREPAHRRAADRAEADLADAGLGDARPAGARPGPDRGRRSAWR